MTTKDTINDYIPLEYQDGIIGRPYLKITTTDEDKFIYQLLHQDGPDIHEITTYQSEHAPGENIDPVLKAALTRKFEDAQIITPPAELPHIPPLEDNELLQTLEDGTKNIIKGEISIWVNDTKSFLLDPNLKETNILKYKWSESKAEYIEVGKDVFINAYPRRVELTQSPLGDSRINYKVELISNAGQYPILIEAGSVSHILNEIKENSLLLKSYNAEDHLASILKGLTDQGLVRREYGIDIPGFFYIKNDKKIVAAGYEPTLPEPNEVMEALDVLEDFGAWYMKSETNRADQRSKVATIIKLGLTLPFNYARKQMGLGEYIKPPLAYGKQGSSKTTLFLLPAFLYGLDVLEYEKAGSNIQTQARFADEMGKTTFPVLMDESHNVFTRPDLSEMNKTGLRGLYVRNKLTKTGRKILEPAYSTYLYLSNYNPIRDSVDGTVRRYYIMAFDEDELKQEDTLEVSAFNETWKLKQPTSRLKSLEALGRFAAHTLIENPELLDQAMTDLGDLLINKIYDYADRQPATWITWWAEDESVEDYNEKEKSIILSYIHERVMQAYTRKIQIIDDTGRPDKGFDNSVHDPATYKERFFQVANERVIPWFLHKKIKNEDYFILKSSFAEDLSKYRGLGFSLRSISLKFEDWRYETIRDGNNRAKMIKIPKKVFYDCMID